MDDKILEEIVTKIKSLEDARKEIGEKLRNVNDKLVVPIEAVEINGIVAAVDGGMVKRSFHGVDLIALRAVAVLYYYEKSKLIKVDYYPSSIAEPEHRLIWEPYDEVEFVLASNIERQMKEISLAKEVVEKFEPDFIFLDGSIVPQYTYAPKASVLNERYKELIETYKSLFDIVKQKKTILAGIVKDSRGTRFCEIISSFIDIKDRPVLERSRDSNLLEYVLKKGERTFVFSYASSENPVLKELKEEKINSFYLKTAEFDQPLRVDFLGGTKEANKIAGVLMRLASNESYSIPSILIEADQRAKVSKADLITFYNDLITRLGELSALREKRRNRKPF